MAISRDEVLHVARLARLALTDDEVERLTSELGAILDAVGVVSELDLADVQPTSHPLDLVNVWAEDAARLAPARGGPRERARGRERPLPEVHRHGSSSRHPQALRRGGCPPPRARQLSAAELRGRIATPSPSETASSTASSARPTTQRATVPIALKDVIIQGVETTRGLPDPGRVRARLRRARLPRA